MKRLKVPTQVKPKVESILDSRVKKMTRHGIYMENLIKWRHQCELEDNCLTKGDFNNLGINMEIVNLGVD